MAYQAVLFDVDGTLLDTSGGILAALQRVIEEEGLPVPPIETMRTFIGPPVQDSFQRVFGCDDVEKARLAAAFRCHYQDEGYLFQACPYEGIFELFDRLRNDGTLIGIATYKREDYARRLLGHFGFDAYTPYLFGSDIAGKLTKADIIRNCLTAMGIEDRSQALMVGDTLHDAAGASQLSVPFLAVTFGFGFEPGDTVEGYGSVGVADTPLGILAHIVDDREKRKVR